MTDKKKVLIVDDEVTLVKLVRFLLERHGFEVCAAYGGQESVEIAQKEIPDLILMDIMMPKVDGNEAIKQLREKEITREIPVIILSALGQEAEVARGLESGAVDYLVKPFNPQDLLARVKKILG
ncbi:MAG: response regulator [Candidatus Omnitrophica bacterium]|nr:response regulator [Candidatus Omnitrophota bacterium]